LVDELNLTSARGEKDFAAEVAEEEAERELRNPRAPAGVPVPQGAD
jgi:hypothetical protein